MKNGFIKSIFALGTALLGIHFANEYVSSKALREFSLENVGGEYFNWKGLSIYYTKQGEGKPLILVHSTDPEASSREWKFVIPALSAKRTVYAIDLAGCGNSAKPQESYTSYYFSLLIRSFAENVIGGKCDVITSGNASISGIMALESENIDSLIMIDPTSVDVSKSVAEDKENIYSSILRLPIVGSAIYNVLVGKDILDRKYSALFKDNTSERYDSFLNDCYQTAHTSGRSGRYLLASSIKSLTRFDFSYALSHIEKPICVLEGAYQEQLLKKIDAFAQINENIKTTFIKEAKGYPHVENPDNTADKLLSVLDSFA